MNIIHSTTVGKTTYFKASDVFTFLGLTWDGIRSLKTLNKAQFKLVKAAFKTASGQTTTGEFYGLTDKGIASVCKQHKIKNPWEVKPTIAPSAQIETNREVVRLQQELAGLKALFACSLTVNKALLTPNKDEAAVAGMTSREAIRYHVSNFAQAKAIELGTSDREDLGKLHDLAYNKLYTFFHQLHGVDLKALADEDGVSGLQIAEEEGLLEVLLLVTEKLYA